MAKVIAISGTGDAAAAPLLWTVVIGTAFGIFVGTLLIKPSKKGRA